VAGTGIHELFLGNERPVEVFVKFCAAHKRYGSALGIRIPKDKASGQNITMQLDDACGQEITTT
jgi:hypothetical protein